MNDGPGGADPFRHHPELKALMAPVETSRFRTQQPEELRPMLAERGLDPSIVHSDDVRNAMRAEALAGHSGDLWVFGYGSLMWDPAIHFSEVRRGYLPGYARKFCLESRMGRGSPDAPGLMAGLDVGEGCHGLVFRIPQALVEPETDVLWRREVIFPGYIPTFAPVTCAQGTVTALCFVMDRGVEQARPDLAPEVAARMIGTASGFLGSNLEYLENVVAHLRLFDIEDAAMEALLRQARTHHAEAGGAETPEP